MDTKQYFQDLCLLLFFIFIQRGLCNIDDDYEDGPSFGRCPWIRNKLKNGRVRYRYKGRVAKFLCDSGYELAGKRSSTCVRGQWSNPVPVCVARGCSRVPSVPNGRVTEMYRGALLVYDCNPGYALEGETSIHCDGRRWSTAPPACVIATENPETSCDFESADLCGWSHDPQHDFDWKRNQYVTPSGHVGTGPAFDHTFGESKGGFYLFIEASSPRKVNDTARLFSPVYSSDLSGGCFTFWYHMYGATTGGLRVYLKPESHVFDELRPNWGKYGEQGNQWLRGNMIVPALHENFQIVIEGIRGESYVGDSAIDDVRLTNSLCDSLDNSTDTTENTAQDSCRGRCREVDSGSSCGCNDNCFLASNCCSDYFATCGVGNDTSVQNVDETSLSDYVSKTSSPIEVTQSTLAMGSVEGEDSEKITTGLPKSTIPIEEISSATSETSPFISSTLNTTLGSTTVGSTTVGSTTVGSTTVGSTTAGSTTTGYNSTKTSPFSSTFTTTYKQTTQSTSPSTYSSPVVSTSTFIPSTKTSTSSSTSVAPVISSTNIPSSTTVLKTTISSKTLRTSTISSTSTKSTTTTTQTQPTTFASTTRLSSTDLTSGSSTESTFSASSRNSSPTTDTSTDSTTIFTSSSTSTTPYSTTNSIFTSTRKTYNLRPRSSTVSTTLSTALSTTQSTTLSPTSTDKPFKEETTTGVKTSSSQPTTWHRFTVRPTFKIITQLPPSTPKTTIPPAIYTFTNSRLATQSTKFVNWNRISTLFPDSTTSESYLSDRQKTETATSTSKVPVVISIVIIVVILAVVAVAYYLRKQKNRRQSKLSDDSEMRFLPESEYMEYSDASALDKILTK